MVLLNEPHDQQPVGASSAAAAASSPQHQALEACMAFARSLQGAADSTAAAAAAALNQEITRLYSQGVPCPAEGLAAIASSVADAAVLTQAVLDLFLCSPPTKFFSSVLGALKDLRRFDVLFGVAKRLEPMLVNRPEWAHTLLYGLCHRLVASQQEADLFRAHSWAGAASLPSPLPWFENTFELQDQTGAPQRVQLIAQQRQLAQPVSLVLLASDQGAAAGTGEEFKGMLRTEGGGGGAFVLRSVQDSSRSLHLLWDGHQELVGSLMLHNTLAIRSILARALVPVREFRYSEDCTSEKEKQEKDKTQYGCIPLQRGMCFQTRVQWTLQTGFSVWVYHQQQPSSQDAAVYTVLSSQTLRIAIHSGGGDGSQVIEVNGKATELTLGAGQWTKITGRFLSEGGGMLRLTVRAEAEAEEKSVDVNDVAMHADDEEEIVTLGALDGTGQHGLVSGAVHDFVVWREETELARYPLLVKGGGVAEYWSQLLTASSSSLPPLICCNPQPKSANAAAALIPPPAAATLALPPSSTSSSSSSSGAVVSAPAPLTGLHVGFSARVGFSPHTATGALVVRCGEDDEDTQQQLVFRIEQQQEPSSSPGQIASFTLTVTLGAREVVKVWNVHSSHARTVLQLEFDGQSLTVSNVCRIPLTLPAPRSRHGFYYVSATAGADIKAGGVNGGRVLELVIAAKEADASVAAAAVAPPPPPPPPPPPLQQVQQNKVCAMCTFANDASAVVCAICEGSEFQPSAAPPPPSYHSLANSSSSSSSGGGEWNAAWDAFRDGFLVCSDDASNQLPALPLCWQQQQTTTAASSLMHATVGAPLVVFAGEARLNDVAAYPCLVHFDQQQWRVSVPDVFDLQLDATGRRVVWHSLAWTPSSSAVPLSQLVRSGAPVGLQNMTPGLVNVCFQNSVMQCLFACTAVRNELVLGGSASTSPVLRQLNELFQSLYCSPLAVLRSSALQTVLPRRFREGQQMDAHEFLTFLVGELENDDNNKETSPALLDSVLAVKSWQNRTCLKCGHTRAQTAAVLSYTGVVLNLPRQFQPVTGLRLVVVTSQGDMLPRCGEYETRLQPNLNSATGQSGPFCYLYVERAPGKVPLTMITASKPAVPVAVGAKTAATASSSSSGGAGLEEINQCGIRLYLSRDVDLGPPITDLDLVEASSSSSSALAVGGSAVCGKRYKLAFKSTMPLTHIAVGPLPPPAGHCKLPTALGENGKGELIYLSYSCAHGRPPVTRFSAHLAGEGEGDGEEEEDTTVVEIDGQRWAFSQSNGVGCPITQLSVDLLSGSSGTAAGGEYIELHRAAPVWRILSPNAPPATFPSKQFSIHLVEEEEEASWQIHTLHGALGSLPFEDGVVAVPLTAATTSSKKITLVGKTRADGSARAEWDAQQLAWRLFAADEAVLLHKTHIYQLESVAQPRAEEHVKVLEHAGRTLYARLYKLHANERPINDVTVQFIIPGQEEEAAADDQYREVFRLGGGDGDDGGLEVRICTSSTALNKLPLRSVRVCTASELVQQQQQGGVLVVDKGEVLLGDTGSSSSNAHHLVVEHEQEDDAEWQGTFTNSQQQRRLHVAGRRLQPASGPLVGRRVEIKFGANSFRGFAVPGQAAWGFLPRLVSSGVAGAAPTSRPLFARVDWEHAQQEGEGDLHHHHLRLRSYYFDLRCGQLRDAARVELHRDCKEYWQQGATGLAPPLFTSRVRTSAVQAMFDLEMDDSYVLLQQDMAECASGRPGCESTSLQPHISRKRVELPTTLLVHVNRMRYEGHRTVKDTTITPLEQELMVPGEEDGGGKRYALVAVVSHIGASAESGHYRAYCRYDAAGAGAAWSLLDDGKVTTGLAFHDLINRFERQQRAEETPYLLFYERVGGEEAKASSSPVLPKEDEIVQGFLQKYSASAPLLEARRFSLNV